MYEVISAFVDLQDGNHFYKVGDQYPAGGKPSPERVKELLSKDNRAGYPLIKEVESKVAKRKKTTK